MRIIGGQSRGLKLATPRGREVRPILDRVRESLFGILRREVPEACVADLFAGTGVIGLEALSRGADRCLFIEKDPRCIGTIGENIRRARCAERCEVIRADVFRTADRLAGHGPFDLIFLDPPYRIMRSERHHSRVMDLLERLGGPGGLAEEGMVILRLPSDITVPGQVGPLTQIDRRRYGGMRIAFWKRQIP